MPKPAKSSATKDKHASGFMVRLPEAFRAALLQMAAKTHRKMTVEVQLALVDYLEANGIKAPAVKS